MPRALVFFERDVDASWRPTMVFLGTSTRLEGRALPGSANRTARLNFILTNAVRPNLDASATTDQPGTWEDWIGRAVQDLANGHDTWATEVTPEPSIDALYRREVVGGEVTLATPERLAPTEVIPDLTGYKDVKP
jgi:hypothetical protein